MVNLTRYSERKKRRSDLAKRRAMSMAQANCDHFLSGGAIVNDGTGSGGFFDEGKTMQNFYDMLHSGQVLDQHFATRENSPSVSPETFPFHHQNSSIMPGSYLYTNE